MKKEVVTTLTNEQFGRVLGGGSILDRDTFHSRCDCKSDDTNCPVNPPSADCGTGNCASCGCATYECYTDSYIICVASDGNPCGVEAQ